MQGKLILVPTPIGNLGDITLRAIEALRSADFIYAEDTRTTGVLLKHLQIEKKTSSYHIFNEHQTVTGIVDRIEEGKTIVLVSDAGTPGISDPGFLLVRACINKGVAVECLPGPTAFVPALVKSGLPTDRFTFEGFLPVKKGRQTRLQSLKEEERTMIFYESPHRILKTLKEFSEVFGEDRPCSVSRELTKMFEQTINGSLKEVLAALEAGVVKGEFVVVVSGLRMKELKNEE
jgi:16S rRNA (cytidine1402-2'-O)-methyltransferase